MCVFVRVCWNVLNCRGHKEDIDLIERKQLLLITIPIQVFNRKTHSSSVNLHFLFVALISFLFQFIINHLIFP